MHLCVRRCLHTAGPYYTCLVFSGESFLSLFTNSGKKIQHFWKGRANRVALVWRVTSRENLNPSHTHGAHESSKMMLIFISFVAPAWNISLTSNNVRSLYMKLLFYYVYVVSLVDVVWAYGHFLAFWGLWWLWWPQTKPNDYIELFEWRVIDTESWFTENSHKRVLFL